MFCKAKSPKNKLFLRSNFRPLPSKNVQIRDHFFPLLFPQGFRISKNIGHPTSGSGGKKTFKRYLKSEHMDTRTDGQTDISTYRKHWPRGQMLWKVSMNILEDQVSMNIHSKAYVFENIKMEVPLKPSVTEYVWIGLFSDTSILIYSMTLEVKYIFCDASSMPNYVTMWQNF